MQNLASVADNIENVSRKILPMSSDRKQPIMCNADGVCLYPDSTSISGFSICDFGGSCTNVKGCQGNEVFALDREKCVPLNTPCKPPEGSVSRRTYGYSANGSCDEMEGCVPGWDWDGDGCVFGKSGQLCDPIELSESSHAYVWRFNDKSDCVPTRECVKGVHSTHTGSCVSPGQECSKPIDHQLQIYNSMGECVPAPQCEPHWELVDTSCHWVDRGKSCKAEAEQLAQDNK